MMFPVAPILISAGDATFDRVVKSFRALDSASAYVQDGTTKFLPIKVSFSPKGGRSSMPNSMRIEVSSTKARFFDELFNQVATSTPKNVAHPERDLISTAIVHRPAMAFLIDRDVRGQFLSDLAKNRGWVQKGNLLVLATKTKGRTEVAFDSQNRITSLRVLGAREASIDFRYKYVEDSQIPVIPPTAKTRDGLTPRPELPTNTSGNTLLLCRAIWQSMSRLDGLTVTQQSDQGKFVTTYANSGLTETLGSKNWKYTSGTLQLGGKSTPMGPVQALTSLNKQGFSVSSVSRYVLNKQVPFLDLFNRPQKIWEGGRLSANGRPYIILNIDRPGSRIRLFIHQQTKRIEILSSESVDQKGTRLTTGRMRLSYK